MEQITVSPNVNSVKIDHCLVPREFGYNRQLLVDQLHVCPSHEVKIHWQTGVRPMRCLLSLDLDGTLVRKDGTVSEEVDYALRDLRSQFPFLKMMLNTGRSPSEAAQILDKAHFLPFGLNSYASGGVIMVGFKPFRVKAIPDSVMTVLLEDRRENTHPVWVGEALVKFAFSHLSKRESTELVTALNVLHKNSISAEATPMYWEDANLWAVDVMAKGVNKGSAIREVASLSHILPQNIISVGDAHNDIPAYKESGLSVNIGCAEGMGGKATANTARNAEEDGFLEALEMYIIPFLEERNGRN